MLMSETTWSTEGTLLVLQALALIGLEGERIGEKLQNLRGSRIEVTRDFVLDQADAVRRPNLQTLGPPPSQSFKAMFCPG